jgi:iron complex outermembrane receptor protein
LRPFAFAFRDAPGPPGHHGARALGGVPAAAREIEQIPGGADLVDAETYKRGRASTLQDALGYSPGIFVQPRFGAEEARLSIRGSGLQRTFHGRGLKLLQDGVPLNLVRLDHARRRHQFPFQQRL